MYALSLSLAWLLLPMLLHVLPSAAVFLCVATVFNEQCQRVAVLSSANLAEVAVLILNLVLGHHAFARFYWEVEVKVRLATHFRDAMSPVCCCLWRCPAFMSVHAFSCWFLLAQVEASWGFDLRQSITGLTPVLLRTILSLNAIVLASPADSLVARAVASVRDDLGRSCGGHA